MLAEPDLGAGDWILEREHAPVAETRCILRWVVHQVSWLQGYKERYFFVSYLLMLFILLRGYQYSLYFH